MTERRQVELLSNAEIRHEFGIGRDLATEIIIRLPHLTIGHVGRGVRRLVRRSDLERFFAHAVHAKTDLWDLVRQHDAASLMRWLNEVN